MENTATEHCINKKSIFAYYENGLINELSGRPYTAGQKNPPQMQGKYVY
jgi:hypothetical protein